MFWSIRDMLGLVRNRVGVAPRTVGQDSGESMPIAIDENSYLARGNP